MHQDIFLPLGWEEQFFANLKDLESVDSNWGVIGSKGVLPAVAGQAKALRGHWCDLGGYQRIGPFPAEVFTLDEQWLGVRKRRGVKFDKEMPGYHCYGVDISLTARAMGLKSYALDTFVWHKYESPELGFITRPEYHPKRKSRWSPEFVKEFNLSAI